MFLGENAIIITSEHDTTIFFSHYNLFQGKRKEKLARKARVNTERVYQIMLMPPGHPTILLKSNSFNMAAVSVKRSVNLVGDGCYVIVMLGKWTRGFKPIGKIEYFEFVYRVKDINQATRMSKNTNNQNKYSVQKCRQQHLTLPFLKTYAEKDLSNQQLWPLPWIRYRQRVSISSDSSCSFKITKPWT